MGPSKSWMFRSGFSTTCNYNVMCTRRAAGRVASTAVPACLSPPLSCLSRRQLENHIPAIMFWKWVWRNEIFISWTVPWQILCDTCDRFRAESQPCWKWLPPHSLWWGTEEERVCGDKSCWSSESRFISLLSRCITRALRLTWSVGSLMDN